MNNIHIAFYARELDTRLEIFKGLRNGVETILRQLDRFHFACLFLYNLVYLNWISYRLGKMYMYKVFNFSGYTRSVEFNVLNIARWKQHQESSFFI